jgi:hypothetical protein
MAAHRSKLTWLLWLLAGCSSCSERVTPPRSEQSAASGPLASGAVQGPKPSGTPLPAASLQHHLPESLAGAAPTGPATLHSLPLANGGVMSIVRRTYKQGERETELELGDALHAAVPRQLIVSQQGVARRSEQSIFLGEAIDGQPALVQWHGPSRTALAHIVVADRFLVNLRVSPASDEQPARAAAHALPIAALVAFARAQPATGEPTTAEPSKATPSAPSASEATKAEAAAPKSQAGTDKAGKNAPPTPAKPKP